MFPNCNSGDDLGSVEFCRRLLPFPSGRFLRQPAAPSWGCPLRVPGQRGSVLLEVVLALALFVAAATVINAGISASIQSTERLRLQNHAANLALSVMSEMEMHLRPIAAAGPEPFPAPFQDWTCKIELSQTEESAPDDAGALQPVEVIIRHVRENTVHRMTRLFRASEITDGTTNLTAEPLLQTSTSP